MSKRCKATLTIRGLPFECEKVRGHLGPHTSYDDDGGCSYGFTWEHDGLSVDYPVPTLSAFDKAWEDWEFPVERDDYKEIFRAGWQALWEELSKWGCACPGTTPVDLNGFRAAMHRYNTKATE